MSKAKIQNIAWSVASLLAIMFCTKNVLDLIKQHDVNWISIFTVSAIGFLLGILPFVPKRLVTQQSAGLWFALLLGGYAILRLWPEKEGDWGISFAILVGCISHFCFERPGQESDHNKQ